jgi:hypothetical protein
MFVVAGKKWCTTPTCRAVVAAMFTLPRVMRARAFMRVVSVSISCMCCRPGGAAQRRWTVAVWEERVRIRQVYQTAIPYSYTSPQTQP